MAKVVVKSKVKKIKRKFPVEIIAPEYLGSKKLGSSKVTDLKQLVGKTSKINLMYITGSGKNQNIRLIFKIVEVNSGVAKTEIISYNHVPYYLGRFVKANSDLIEDSFVVESKDNVNIRIKPFIVTKNHVSSMISTSVRSLIKNLIIKEVSSKNSEEFMNYIISNKYQNLFRNEIKKIVPVKTFEFRKVEFE